MPVTPSITVTRARLPASPPVVCACLEGGTQKRRGKVRRTSHFGVCMFERRDKKRRKQERCVCARERTQTYAAAASVSAHGAERVGNFDEAHKQHATSHARVSFEGIGHLRAVCLSLTF